MPKRSNVETVDHCLDDTALDVELGEVELFKLCGEIHISLPQAIKLQTLLRNGNSVPFISRYRKEVTDGLDEERVRCFAAALKAAAQLEKRRTTVINSLKKEDKLTRVLAEKIKSAPSLSCLEDLYLPYKPKRTTRASAARAKNLEPLAKALLAGKNEPIPMIIRSYTSAKGLDCSLEEAVAGAQDIIAEMAAELPEVRAAARKLLWAQGRLVSSRSRKTKAETQGDKEEGKIGKNKAPKAIEKTGKSKDALKAVECMGKSKGSNAESGTYANYFDFTIPLAHIKPHQVMAINRGEDKGWLTVGFKWHCIRSMEDACWSELTCGKLYYEHHAIIRSAITDGLTRLMMPAIEREARSTLTATAVSEATRTFGGNLRRLLTAPPLRGKVVMGVDPGFTHGCKIAVCNSSGDVLAATVIYPLMAHKRVSASQELLGLIEQHQVEAIALGNGVGCSQTEVFLAEVLKEHATRCSGRQVGWVVVAERGASVYSASPLARQELPSLDVSLRGAVSIARRLQDPLAELVKVESRHLGVGMYQHDVKAGVLGAALDEVVESVVAAVGVDLETASPALLAHVPGLNASLAEKIVSWRREHTIFKCRQELLEIKGLGPKTFEQCAGFLRISSGANALDATSVHPESYSLAANIIRLLRGEKPFKSKQPVNNKMEEKGTTTKRRKVESTSLHQEAVDLKTLEQASSTLKTLLKHVSHEGKLAAHSDISKQTWSTGRLAETLGVSRMAVELVVEGILARGDTRGAAPSTSLRTQVGTMRDLQRGMVLEGTITNVVPFGMFVDVHCGRDGLVPKTGSSANENRPESTEGLGVGDEVTVEVINVDVGRNRLTLKLI